MIILFGSRARGDYTESSDYDVLVVGDEIPKDPRRVDDKLYMEILNMFPGEVQPLFINTEIFIKRLESSEPFLLQIIEEGKVIKKDEDFWKEVVRIYEEKRKEWIRLGKVWIRKRRRGSEY